MSNDLTNVLTAKVATRLRMQLMQSGIGFSIFDDRVKHGNGSVWIDIDSLAKSAVEAIRDSTSEYPAESEEKEFLHED